MMNKKRSTILSVILLVVVVAIAYAAYTSLSKKYKPNSKSESSQQQSSQSLLPQLESSQPQSSKSESSQSQSSQPKTSSQTQSSQPKASSQSQSSQSPSSSRTRDPNSVKASDFTVVDANGKAVKLSSFKGKPVVVNFWASWCGPCQSEMPHFNKLYNQNKNNIQFMMVDLVDGQRETLDKGKQFIAKNKYTFPVFYDINQDASRTYAITSIPVTLFIDKDGYIVKKQVGAMDENTLASSIELIK